MTIEDTPTGWRRYRCRCGYRWETPRVFPDDDPRCRVCDRPAEAVTEAVAVAVTTTLPTVAEAASERHDCVTVNIHGEKADEHRR